MKRIIAREYRTPFLADAHRHEKPSYWLIYDDGSEECVSLVEFDSIPRGDWLKSVEKTLPES